ncbi:hypothetical protein BH23GEM9_BH23GEM9_28680 [soil metagenome]
MNAMRSFVVIAALATLSCGGGSGPADPGAGMPATMTQLAPATQTAVVANSTPVAPEVVVTDGAGQPVADVQVTFTVVGGEGHVTRSTMATTLSGRASTDWYLGPRAGDGHRLRATAGGLVVEFAATATPLVSGAQYLGAKAYVEMIPGDLPVIISAPHGGLLEPTTMPDRTGSSITTVRDFNTQVLAHDIAAALRARTGKSPTLVIMRLDRKKIDANREIIEAAQGNPEAERAWHQFHGFIEAARAILVDRQQPGFYIDLHGHAHPIARIEWGYRLTTADLGQTDAMLNSSAMVQKSSVGALAAHSGAPHAEIVRGPNSLGALLEARGFPSVPSLAQPDPGDNPYFSGGYNTSRHASRDGNLISGVQLEAYRIGIRDTDANRAQFSASLAEALDLYFATWYNTSLSAN